MTLWTPRNTNIFEEQFVIKIESLQAEIRKIRAQIDRTESMLQSAEIHEHLLWATWSFLSQEAKVVSLNEARVIKKSLISTWSDIVVLKMRIEDSLSEIIKMESEISTLEVEKERVKFKVIELKR